MATPIPAWALIGLTLSSASCVTVLERVRRDDIPLGGGKVLEERVVASAVDARAELRGNELVVRLDQQQTCQRRVEEKVRRVERVERRFHPYAYSILGCELLGGCLASSIAISALLLPSTTDSAAIVNRVFWAIGATAVAGWLFGAFGYQVYFVNDEGERASEARAERWTAAESCRSTSLAGAEVAVGIGSIQLRGRTAADGAVVLAPPAGLDLASLLTGASWRAHVVVTEPAANLVVEVSAPAAPAAAPAAGTYGEEPPPPDGPPGGLPPPSGVDNGGT